MTMIMYWRNEIQYNEERSSNQYTAEWYNEEADDVLFNRKLLNE